MVPRISGKAIGGGGGTTGIAAAATAASVAVAVAAVSMGVWCRLWPSDGTTGVDGTLPLLPPASPASASTLVVALLPPFAIGACG